MTAGKARATVLVTGGAGYIGSHTTLALLRAGYAVVVLDNLSTGHEKALRRVEQLAQRPVALLEGDIRDHERLRRVFNHYPIDAVIHFAGLKSAAESVRRPDDYQAVNVRGSRHLLDAMETAGVHRLVFSSSATVYGRPEQVPVSEDAPTLPVNPYGHGKLQVEELLHHRAAADSRWRMAALRYFNPAGAHPDGDLGEDAGNAPHNLFPRLARVALGHESCLPVFGTDFPTPDGSAVRDYIHVMDLARAHVAALTALERTSGMMTLNLGTGRGYSVREIIHAFGRASGQPIPHEPAPARPGDVPCYYADPHRAHRLLDWRARFDLITMCADYWRWCRRHPEGY